MYYNEAGEPLGWDYPSIDDPHHEEYEWFIRPIDIGEEEYDCCPPDGCCTWCCETQDVCYGKDNDDAE